mmetsp:Transcript_29836/g.63486  ORF Transcript_29836/g.63486 Transcript_29836/m.63486 type:complete len:200 (-) Transcript_29836:36-635(-)
MKAQARSTWDAHFWPRPCSLSPRSTYCAGWHPRPWPQPTRPSSSTATLATLVARAAHCSFVPMRCVRMVSSRMPRWQSRKPSHFAPSTARPKSRLRRSSSSTSVRAAPLAARPRLQIAMGAPPCPSRTCAGFGQRSDRTPASMQLPSSARPPRSPACSWAWPRRLCQEPQHSWSWASPAPRRRSSERSSSGGCPVCSCR